jgi:pimeloyl-ACP methyl ester carboxylesterase
VVTFNPAAGVPRRGYADGPFGQIHFQALGGGQDLDEGVPLVLLHQAPMTSNQFDMVYAQLAALGVRAIGIDMPGFGHSDPTDFVPGAADYARIVPPVLAALGIGSAAVLGHHTGALVAAEAARLFPDQVSRLILNGPLLVSEEELASFMDGLHKWELDFVARDEAAHMVELFAIRNRLASGTIPAARLSDYVIQALIGRGPFWYGHHAAYTAPLATTLPQIGQPTLILSNTGDMIYPHAVRAHEMRPDFEFFALEGGGVDIVDQQPDEWAAVVAKFVHAAA